ncbi:MAG: DNA repair protein RecN [Paracoccaceae bacterium]|nr:DNA repair protein RecN [Paracoccaceae bacterium]MYG10724.1 DNA repair protein RecN [Paracoccaceae bacterium]
MLKGISLRKILFVEELDLEFSPNLNILSGETGAGKSFILDSLGFALGFESPKDFPVSDKSGGEVSVCFEVSEMNPIRTFLDKRGYQSGTEIFIRRTLSPGGRSVAFINNSRCSSDFLKEVALFLINIHGQHDTSQLLNKRSHKDLLDKFGGHEKLVNKVRELWTEYQLQTRSCQELENRIQVLVRDQEFTAHSLLEFRDFDLKENEHKTLESRRTGMKFAARNREAIEMVAQNIGSGGITKMAIEAINALGKVKGGSEEILRNAQDALERVLVEVDDAERNVDELKRNIDVDPYELENLENRLFAIRALARKHNVQPDELFGFWNSLEDKSAELAIEQNRLKDLAKARKTSYGEYHKNAELLTKARKKAAQKLDRQINTELPPLKLENAIFRTSIQTGQEGSTGKDDVQFLASTNPGISIGPINKIASGGELSRFLLALKVCLTNMDTDVSMVFDEIDSGIGGATADAVGKKLMVLSGNSQVVAITHSPQVASLGSHHFKIEKHVKEQDTRISVELLDEERRIDEIARMLSAETITDEAKSAAKVLLGK